MSDTTFTEERIAELRKAFDLFDRDKDGRITSDDLGSIVFWLGCNPTYWEFIQLLREADALNGDETIDFNQFLALMARDRSETESPRRVNKNVLLSEEKLLELLLETDLFWAFDEDGNKDFDMDFDDWLNMALYP